MLSQAKWFLNKIHIVGDDPSHSQSLLWQLCGIFRKTYKMSESTHYTDTEIIDTALPQSQQSVHLWSWLLPLWYWPYRYCAGSPPTFGLPSAVSITWKRPSLSEQGPTLRPDQQEIDLLRLSQKYEALRGRVSGYGRRCIAEMTCWWPGGEEAPSPFTAEDRNVARNRSTTGMPHILQCWKQSKVGAGEKNQISTKRCQQ